MPGIEKQIIWIVLGLFVYGCKPQKADRMAMDKYLHNESNGLLKTKERNHMRVKAMYYPYQLLVCRETENAHKNKDSLIAAYTSLYKKYLYISLSISAIDESGGEHYPDKLLADVIRRRSGLNGEDMNILIRNEDGTEVPLAYSMCNDGYGTIPEIQVLVAFENEKIKEGFTFHVEGLYDHVGDDFIFSTQNINAIPVINYN